MADLAEMQSDDRGGRRAQRAPRWWDSGRGWALGSGVVIEPGQGAHVRALAARRGGDRDVRRRPARRAGAVAAADPELDLAVLSVDTGRHRAGELGAGRGTRHRHARCWRSPTPAGAACASRSGSCRRRAAASGCPRGRRDRGRRRAHRPAPARLVRRAARGHRGRARRASTRVRLDGGLILALPASADVKRARARARRRRGARAPRGSAWRWPRRGWRAGCAGRWGSPSTTACSCARSSRAAPRPRPAWSAAT